MESSQNIVGADHSALDHELLLLVGMAPREAARHLETLSDARAAGLLAHLNSSLTKAILGELSAGRCRMIAAAAPPELARAWQLGGEYPENSVGNLMLPPVGEISEAMTVPEAIEEVRRLALREPITYLYPVDASGRLTGVVVLRDLFLATPDTLLAKIMIRPPFFLRPDMTLLEAMKAVVSRHYPVYPVCGDDDRLLGLVRGHALFEKQAFVISAQSGTMVGVRSQERISTSFLDSLRYRHPWLQLNLFLSLLAAIVVAYYKEAIEKLVVLAIFSPLVTAQARNSGAQTMAIVLRALSTGEWKDGDSWRVIGKEVALALLNGLSVGAVAGAIMFWQSRASPHRWLLAMVMLASMGAACAISAVFGILTPLVLRRLGADPALAAGILLSTVAGILGALIFFALAQAWIL